MTRGELIAVIRSIAPPEFANGRVDEESLAEVMPLLLAVAAAEREACAKACEAGIQDATDWDSGPLYHGPGPDADIAARAAAAETPRTVQYLWDGPPPRREWVSLTDQEIATIEKNSKDCSFYGIARAVEHALRQKNGARA